MLFTIVATDDPTTKLVGKEVIKTVPRAWLFHCMLDTFDEDTGIKTIVFLTILIQVELML